MNETQDDHDFIAQALPAFISEAHEQIAAYEALLLKLEDAPADRELLDALFRCAHTVKGSAGMFGLDRVVGFTHHVETLLDRVRAGQVALTPALSTLLLQCNDEIRELVHSAGLSAADESTGALAARAALVTRLHAAGQDAGRAEGPRSAAPQQPPAGVQTPDELLRWHLSAHFGVDTFRNGLDPIAILGYLRGMGTVTGLACHHPALPPLETLDVEACHLGFEFDLDTTATRPQVESAFSFVRDDCELRIDAVVGAAPILTEADLAPAWASATTPVTAAAKAPAEAAARPVAGEETRYIRVQADRLDEVINLLGELVIATAGASLQARQTRNTALVEAHAQISALVEDVRNSTLQLRMVPIGETFARFRRVVRDTAGELGKDVALHIEGGETELDKAVVERIADPLMHLVRNALDHGLEAPAQRLATGKPAQGRLTLAACHESGQIVIRIVDDGRGIQRDKVLARAWDRGLVQRGVVPPDEDIFNLIFEAGFSTAEKVTSLSGRGVGMDVVRRNIEALRGTVMVSSTEGQGSCIEIRLPLTLAIIDGFLVGVAASKFIFPLESVVEVIERRPSATTQDAHGRSVVELRGRALPVVSLRALYGLEGPEPERCSVVVVQAGTQRCGVLVDLLLGQHQTVIKPLGRLFRSLRGISGSSILGNGGVALIFDVAALNHLAAEAALPQHPTTPRTRQHTGLVATTEGIL